MGYYTSYTLTVPDEHSELIEILREENETAKFAFDSFGEPNDTIKWYAHEEEMIEFSKKHPEVVFTLKGEGEENGDLWKKYFKNGKIQVARAKIIFEDYDETKLQ